MRQDPWAKRREVREVPPSRGFPDFLIRIPVRSGVSYFFIILTTLCVCGAFVTSTA